MQTSSADYKTAIASPDRQIKGYLKFNGSFVLSGEDGLISFKTTQNAMDAERFCVGSVTSAFCEASFYNEGLEGSGVSLANCYFDAYIGVVTDSDNNTVEYVCCGRYYVSEVTRSTATTRILGYDIAGRLSMDYVPTVTAGSNGYLVMDILNDIIDQTGVNGGDHFTTFGDDVYAPQLFEGNCRAQWGWLCSLVTQGATSYSGTREPADLGYIKEYVAGNGVATPYAVDETTTYMDGLALGDEYTITSFTSGTTDDPIVIGNGTGLYGLNPYMTTAVATAIETSMDGYAYYPTTLHWRGDPCLDILDEINVTKGEDTYKIVVMKIETTFNGGLEQTITSYGDSEEYYAMSTSPTQGQINRVSNLVQDIQRAIETAEHGVITQILDTDGTWKELVIANSQDLDSATSVWRFNINGLAHSTQYSGGTYSFALDDQGRLVANIIQTGVLQDASGKNWWNLDTGELHITAWNVKMGGRNLLRNSSVNYENTSSPTATYYFGNSQPDEGSQVTLQVKGDIGSGADSFAVYNSGNSVLLCELTESDFNSTTGIYTKTFDWIVADSDNTSISIYSTPADASRTASIEWVKLERGNQPTDWTPAPEDQAEATAAAQSAAESAEASANNALETTQKVEAVMQFTTQGLKISGTEQSRDNSYVQIGADKQTFVVDNTEVMALGADGLSTQGDITSSGTIKGGVFDTGHWEITENASGVWSLNYHA